MKLVNFLKKLKNEQVTVELKNGQTVFGTVSQVTPQMNVVLNNVQLKDGPSRRSGSNKDHFGSSVSASAFSFYVKDNSVNLQYINIRGNTIRQIILPDSLNIDTILASMDNKDLNQLKRKGRVNQISTGNKRGRYNDNNTEDKDLQQPNAGQRQRRIAPMRAPRP